MDKSIVEYFSGHEGYRCGYCSSPDTCYSHGMWAHTMTPLDYQNLIDRGWRRSGKYCYKPTMNVTCCPLYTIRCEAKKFVLTRSQKKVLKKVHRFLAYGEKSKPNEVSSADQDMDTSEFPQDIDVQTLKRIKRIKTTIKQSDIKADNTETNTDSPCVDNSQNEKCDSAPLDQFSSTISSQSSRLRSEPSSPLKSSNLNSKPQCRKAKEIRKERKLQKLLKQGMSEEEASALIKPKINEPKSIEDFLAEPFPPNPAHKLELRLVPSSIENPLFSKYFDDSYNVYKKYQMSIHKDPAEKVTTKQYTRFLVTNPFQFRMVPCNMESEEFVSTFDKCHKLYTKYQMKIHKDTEEECAKGNYENFLVETPFKNLRAFSSSSFSFGSYHQQYWLDDKIIAVAVLDILPYCVSSVYFYYDPDYSFLSLGTYAALREIALTRELNTKRSDLQYYYMGYYIHSCVKMRYKGQFVPSFLLCPETYIFKPIEKCKPLLDISKYHRLEEDPKKEDTNGIVNLNQVLILYDNTRMTYATYRNLSKIANDEDDIRKYAHFVGRKCCKRMLLYRKCKTIK
ncbi:arginyl-tRNA--protein transferase 1 [Trichonephila clavata]|uniref:Arginyl-tRNA--protein transferase 1 n=1 Tax=Trichonephila clavata TaxID=2740835 RepID=A0A8X6GV91_TRICU|nr:arginyl-tRNA--protein transferase 1 [Trichonephila clavata]